MVNEVVAVGLVWELEGGSGVMHLGGEGSDAGLTVY